MQIWELIQSGGFAMYPLLACSMITWAVVFERLWQFRRLNSGLKTFHLEALNALLHRSQGGNHETLRALCNRYDQVPSARLIAVALERLGAQDARLRNRWMEALERRRQLINQELRQNLWLLGTIGSAAPFIGLFGTVIGILSSFQEMARTGSGGFAVVAAGISESLIATAAGIVVAVVAVMAYNAFQTRLTSLVLTIKIHTEELAEMLAEQNSHGS